MAKRTDPKTKSKPAPRVRTSEEEATELEERAASLKQGDVGRFYGVGLAPKARQRHLHVAELLRSAATMLEWSEGVAEFSADPKLAHNLAPGWEQAVRKRMAGRMIEAVALLGLCALAIDPHAALESLVLRLDREHLGKIDPENLSRWALTACGVDPKRAGKWIDDAHALGDEVRFSADHLLNKALPLVALTPGGIGPLGDLAHLREARAQLWRKSNNSP